MTTFQATMVVSISVLVFLLIHTTVSSQAIPIDTNATQETNRLLSLLTSVSNNPQQILFGQHKATMVGVTGGHTPYRVRVHNTNERGWAFTVTIKLWYEKEKRRDLIKSYDKGHYTHRKIQKAKGQPSGVI